MDIRALATELATIQEESTLRLIAGKAARKTASSVVGMWVTCTDGTKAARFKGSPIAAGDEVYLLNISDDPRRKAWVVLGAEGDPVNTLSVNYYLATTSSTGNYTSGNEATRIATRNMTDDPFPAGTWGGEMTLFTMCNRTPNAVGTGVYVYLYIDDDVTPAGTGFITYNNAGEKPVYFAVPVTGLSGGQHHTYRVTYRGDGAAGTTYIFSTTVHGTLHREG